jgi:hypothetical protein
MEELLKGIGIKATGEFTKNGAYVVDIRDYDDYSKFFSLLEKSDLEEVQDTAQITVHTTNVTFASDEYQIVLQADLDEDLYKLVVTEY